jgi:hypothetical protein
MPQHTVTHVLIAGYEYAQERTASSGCRKTGYTVQNLELGTPMNWIDGLDEQT